jgi:hypothetical protein
VKGWARLSNCEASTMYIRITDNKEAHRNSLKVVSRSRAGAHPVILGRFFAQRSWRALERRRRETTSLY